MVSGNFADACIMNGTCKQGITGTFWIKYDAGDFIFTTTRSADQGEAYKKYSQVSLVLSKA